MSPAQPQTGEHGSTPAEMPRGASLLSRLSRPLRTLLAPAPPTPPAPPAPPAMPPEAVPEGFTELTEGLARALHRQGAVFYNPAQVVNRDLSVLVLRWLARQSAPAGPLRVLEALSATGLRAVRYFREVPRIAAVVANDLDPAAVETIRRNVRHNRLDPDHHVLPSHADALDALAAARPRDRRFAVVDLDPYGSAAPFLEAAVQAVADGGLLAVTCTDLAVLCGNSPEVCWSRYGATPLKAPFAHELAVRAVLGAAQAAANRHSRALEPVVCVKIDFYVRLFLRVRDSKSLAQQTPANMCMVVMCSECGTHRTQPLGRVRANPVSNAARKRRRKMQSDSGDGKQKDGECPNAGGKPDAQKQNPPNLKYSPALLSETIGARCSICGGAQLVGGPVWAGPLVGEDVAASVLEEIESGEGAFKARERVSAIVRLVDEEVRSVPFFLHLPSMCKVLRVSPPPAASVRAFLGKRGYQVSQSHTDPQAIKTDAPPELVWDLLRLWVEKVGSPLQKGEAREVGKDGRPPAGVRILQKKAELVKMEEVDFSIKKDRFVRRGNVEKPGVRFPQNPEPYWGPKARAGKRKSGVLEPEAQQPQLDT